MARRIGLIAILALAVASIAIGQQDQGVITGTVSDATGAVIPGALVSIRQVDTGITLEKETNASGIYVSGPLKVGVYEVSVGTEGFKPGFPFWPSRRV